MRQLDRQKSTGFVSVWVSLIIGIICLMMSQNFIAWLVAGVTGQTYATNVNWTAGPKVGQPVSFFDLQGGTAWTQVGTFTLGAALLIEAAVMLLWSQGKLGRVGVFTSLAVGLLALVTNVAVAGYVFSLGILPIFSLLAVAVAGMIVFERKEMI